MQREIKVIANSQNRNEVYMSEASTFGELKAELLNKGYEVEEMDFKEGKSRIDLRDEFSPLPTNFMYHGVETNDLVIMITPKNTKIKSGITNYRRDMYNKIVDNNLQSYIQERTGRNFTNCSDSTLTSVLADWEFEQLPSEPQLNEEAVRNIVKEEFEKRDNLSEYSLNSLGLVLMKIIDFLEKIMPTPTNLIKNWKNSIKKTYEPYTEEELQEMF